MQYHSASPYYGPMYHQPHNSLDVTPEAASQDVEPVFPLDSDMPSLLPENAESLAATLPQPVIVFIFLFPRLTIGLLLAIVFVALYS